MNLDEQLRAALNLEAEMRTAPPLDTDGLISGGQSRRRRRNALVAAGSVLGVVLIGGGIYGAVQLGGDPEAARPPEVATQPSEDAGPPRYSEQDEALEPGTYRKRVGNHDDGTAIDVDLTVDGPDWTSGTDPVVKLGRSETDWGGIAVYQPSAFAGADGCGDWSGSSRTAGATTDQIAQQIASLPLATVLQAPSTTEALGHEAVHVRVRVDDSTCPSVYNWAEDSLGGGHGLSYYHDFERESRQAVVDATVVDVDGTPIVVALFHHSDAAPEVIAQVTSARDSISLVPSD